MGNDKDVPAPGIQEPPSTLPEYTAHGDLAVGHDHIEPVPTYSEHDNPYSPLTLQGLRNVLAERNRTQEQDLILWRRYLESGPGDSELLDADFSPELFSAIEKGHQDVIALLIEHGLVTANTKAQGTKPEEETPLLKAVASRNVQVVQLLLSLGAEPDEFGYVSKTWDRDLRAHVSILRTPLQLAASLGHLVLVKLFVEQYHCDDSLVAPDGQIALRLAAENGHREVVDYLPSRRNGGFKRWQFKNRKSLRRIKHAGANAGKFLKFFLFDVEKFFLWTVPKHVIVKPVAKSCKWCWENRKAFGPWCKHQITEMPGRVKRAGVAVGKGLMKFPRAVGRGLAKIPRAVGKFSKGVWKFVTETLPRWCKQVAAWIKEMLTVRLPKALKILGQWIVSGFTSLAKAVWNSILKVISFISTVLSAIVSFFRSLTLADIWNGFVEILRAVFVNFPKLMWSWIEAFGDTSYKMMKALFGLLGQVLWFVGWGIFWVVTYLPMQLWKVLQSIGGSLAKAGYEVRVWFDPKAR